MNSLSTNIGFVAAISVCVRAICLAGVAVVLGCAAVATRPEVEVRNRAQERWNQLVKGEVISAYQFLSPASRAVLKAEDYVSSIRRNFWKSAEVKQVQCATPDSCVVDVLIEYEYGGNRMKAGLQESWIKERSEWWYVQK